MSLRTDGLLGVDRYVCIERITIYSGVSTDVLDRYVNVTIEISSRAAL